MFKGLVNTLSCVHLLDEGHNMFKYSPVWAKYSELQKIFPFCYGKFYCILNVCMCTFTNNHIDSIINKDF